MRRKQKEKREQEMGKRRWVDSMVKSEVSG